MPTPRRKISRKELKQPDELTSILESAEDFLFNNLTQVIVSAAIVLAVGAIAGGTYMYEVHRDRVTASHFYAAMSALNAKNYDTAAADFNRLAKAEPNRRLGRLSLFYAAIAYMGENDLPHARDSLIGFLGTEHDPTYMNLARTDLAVVYEKMGDFAAAANEYRQAAAVPGPEQTRAELGVARMMMQQGNNKGAIEVYRQFLEQHPFSEQRPEVLESLAMLGVPPVPPAPKGAAAIDTPSASRPVAHAAASKAASAAPAQAHPAKADSPHSSAKSKQ